MDGHRTRRSTKTEKAEAQKEQQQRGGRHGRTERETERGAAGVPTAIRTVVEGPPSSWFLR